MITFTSFMKKFLLTIMAFVYLAVATGANVHLHYCMDKLVSWNLAASNTVHCPVCNSGKQSAEKSTLSCKGCCKDEFKQVKLGKDHKAEQHFPVKISIDQVPVTYYSYELHPAIPTTLVGAYNINAPPRKHSVPDFIFFCTFLI